MEAKELVARHYGSSDLKHRVRDQINASGLDLENLSPADLAPLDQLHSRGPASTRDLVELGGFSADDQVLDVGGGLGGPARMLASQIGCQVTVLDLTAEFVETGRMLTEMTKLGDLVTMMLGDATAMPFADETFDVAWTQHTTMNIENKEALYGEIHRVLKPGGRLVMQEIVAGNGEPIHFPVCWASSPKYSFLLKADDVRALISRSGFREVVWRDETQKAIQSAEQLQASSASPPPVRRDVVEGPEFPALVQGVIRNAKEGRIAVIVALFERN